MLPQLIGHMKAEYGIGAMAVRVHKSSDGSGSWLNLAGIGFWQNACFFIEVPLRFPLHSHVYLWISHHFIDSAESKNNGFISDSLPRLYTRPIDVKAPMLF